MRCRHRTNPDATDKDQGSRILQVMMMWVLAVCNIVRCHALTVSTGVTVSNVGIQLCTPSYKLSQGVNLNHMHMQV